MEQSDMKDYVFALDIGTRSIIGMVGVLKNEKLNILAIEKQEHSSRAMVDGQIEDISRVAKVAENVRKEIEEKIGVQLEHVHVAAAGRALKTGKASFELELKESQTITEEIIKKLESGAIAEAEQEFEKGSESDNRQFYLIGYSVCQYYLDDYPISNLQDHKGKRLKADVIATFLPGEVVESLYASMKKAGLEVASMTLEPIASMNAAIPQKLRLLNLALVDIGAGTSDISVSRDGSIAGYTMATVAGDEITECLMKEFLTDFETAERLKMKMGVEEEQSYYDVLGFEHMISPQKVKDVATSSIQLLCKQIAEKIIEVNGTPPSAVFLTGGGSKLDGVREYISQYLDMDMNRVALGGNNFSVYAGSEEYNLKDPEYSTPLGIAVSAAFNLINDSFYIKLNGQRAKLFRSGKLTIRDVLMMNGYGYRHLISHSGQNLVINIDGKRTVIYGGYATPAHLTLNGEDAVVSDLVKAGDEILFHPATNGEDAKATLGDIVTLEKRGTVLWEGQEIPLGVSAFLNGHPGTSEQELVNGDMIQLCRIETAGDFAEHYEVEGIMVVNGSGVSSDWKLESGDLLEIQKKVPEQKIEQELNEEEDSLQKKDSLDKKETLHFKINGKEIILSEKEDKMPYYLMDMLAYADLDASKPKGDLQLKINGVDAAFQNVVYNGDIISIAWSENQKS